MVAIDLAGKTAIVTGAGKGIGRAIALRLGEAGANTVVSDLSQAQADAVAQEIVAKGGTAIGVQTDVSKQDQVDAMVQKAVDTYKTVDILMNNAGVSLTNLFLDATEQELDVMIGINLKGTMYTCKAVLPLMIQQGEGKIINMASMAPKAPSAFHAFYAATKAGIISMTESIATEYGAQNIKANCICPGIVRTDMWESSLANMGSVISVEEEAIWKDLVAAVPLKRPQTPEDIANTVLFLASPLGENISAQAINVNGGQLAN